MRVRYDGMGQERKSQVRREGQSKCPSVLRAEVLRNWLILDIHQMPDTWPFLTVLQHQNSPGGTVHVPVAVRTSVRSSSVTTAGPAGKKSRREEFDIPEVFFEMSTSFLPPPDDADSYSTKKGKQKNLNHAHRPPTRPFLSHTTATIRAGV